MDIVGMLTNPIVMGGVAIVLGYILKIIPNEKIKNSVGKLMKGLGVTVTAGLSKYPLTKPYWNKYVEPYVIDAIDNIVVHGIREFVTGMRSDNMN